jgi:hypothetical protein
VPANLSQEARQVVDDYYAGISAEEGNEITDDGDSLDSGKSLDEDE